MNGNDPDLEAFESNLHAIIRATDWGKTGALESLPECIRPSICRRYDCVSTLNKNSTSAHHHLIASLLQTIHWMILKHPQNGSSNDISTLLLADGSQGKLMKTQFDQLWRSTVLPIVPVPPTKRKIFTIRRRNPTGKLLKLPIRGHVLAKSASRWQWRCSCVGVRKDPGRNWLPGIPLKCSYLTLNTSQ